jgi:prepilin-type N-terminal cleavage/methylation domain-containing protein
MIFRKIKQKNNGFTLVELMVASTLFTFIMMMGVGSLVMSSNSAKSSQKLRTAVDNVNFAMESMARELRTGTVYTCETTQIILSDSLLPKDCPTTYGNIIAFKPQSTAGGATRVAYELKARADGTNTLIRCEFISPSTVTPCPEVVSSEVDIKSLKFYVVGSALPPDTIQPSVEILIKGQIIVKGVITPFILQTMASQRSAEK